MKNRRGLLGKVNGRILRRMGYRLERTRPTRREIAEFGGSPPLTMIEDAKDVRYRTIDWTYSAPVSLLVGRPVFGYGSQSWHPLVAACKQLLDDPDTPYEDSLLRRFYSVYTPQTIAEAYFLEDAGPLGSVPAHSLFEPWALSPPPFDDPFATEAPSGSLLFGPVPDSVGIAAWARLKASVDSIIDYGYQPELFPRGRIGVIVLRSGAEERYLVAHGQHRAAVLAAMGVGRLEVAIHPTLPSVVDEREARAWPYVVSGFITESQAVETLRRYFNAPDADPALRIAAACQHPKRQDPTTRA